MKTPTLSAIHTKPSRKSRHSRIVLLLAALTLLCGNPAFGPLCGGHEPQTSRTRTEPLAAQNDAARELAAKLSSLNSVVRAGLGLLLLGLLSLAYPPFRVLVHGASGRVVLFAGGLGLMVLPTIIVGNERLILGALVLGLGAWQLRNRALRKHGRAAKKVCPAISGSGPVKSSRLSIGRGG